MIDRFEQDGITMVRLYDMVSDRYVEMTEQAYESLDKRPMLVHVPGAEHDDS